MQNDLINAGYIAGVFGVKGWVKVFSHTDPRENILRYSPWLIEKNHQRTELKVLAGRRHGNNVVAELDSISDRDTALALTGAQIYIHKQQLPKPADGEYYWADLIGLRVENVEGVALGVVDHLLETGANDVLVVIEGETQRLIPFLLQHTVKQIDLENRSMQVDWDPDF